MAAAIGSATSSTSRAPARSAESRTARFSTSVMPEGTQMITRGRTRNLRRCTRWMKYAQQVLGHLEVGDDAVA